MTQDAFNALWTLDEMPACDEGMVLLKAWVEDEPEAIGYLFDIAWAVPAGDIAENPRWRAYLKHRFECPDCNEM